ncbi:MAG: hypothetical protein FD169_1572 [Bacillota bacterium]|nr:MAG: hypothetical protein FD169_1572 [Bacillota bacterium]
MPILPRSANPKILYQGCLQHFGRNSLLELRSFPLDMQVLSGLLQECDSVTNDNFEGDKYITDAWPS